MKKREIILYKSLGDWIESSSLSSRRNYYKIVRKYYFKTNNTNELVLYFKKNKRTMFIHSSIIDYCCFSVNEQLDSYCVSKFTRVLPYKS